MDGSGEAAVAAGAASVNGAVDGDYLSAYRAWFERFAAQLQPRDQLPVNITGYSITREELVGAVLRWTSQYLSHKDCPNALRPVLCRRVLAEVPPAVAAADPLLVDYQPATDQYMPLKLMQFVIERVNALCLRYLDNSELDRLPPPAPTSRPSCAGACKNQRRAMEDRHVDIPCLEELFQDPPEESERTGVYAVYDGHGGSAAAEYCATHLHVMLYRSPHFRTDLRAALADAFAATDRLFCQKQGARSGSTAVVVAVRGRQLETAWAGDSQALLVRRATFLPLVNPHRPTREDEKQRVEDLGGMLTFFGTWRICGCLAVSRSIGDKEYKPFVTATPEQTSLALEGDEDLVVVASDGLWDVLSEAGVMLLAYNLLVEAVSRGEPDGVRAIAQSLAWQSRHEGSQDNTSVVVVCLRDPALIAHDLQHSARSTFLKLRRSMEAPSPLAQGADYKEPFLEQMCSRLAEDLGPETAVDDDVQLRRAPSPPGPAKPELPFRPPALASEPECGLVENVGESGDESEDEWNYIQGEQTQPAPPPPRRADREHDRTAWAEDEEDESSEMNSSSLNPDAPVFVPGADSPLSDHLLAESPRKPLPVLDAGEEPLFASEALHRPASPADRNGHVDKPQSPVLNGDNKLLLDMERVQYDTTHLCDVQVGFADTENVDPVGDIDQELLERLKSKERDPMSMSFYRDESEPEPPAELNTVQPLPDSDDDDLLYHTDTPESHKLLFEQVPERTQGKLDNPFLSAVPGQDDFPEQLFDTRPEETTEPLWSSAPVPDTPELVALTPECETSHPLAASPLPSCPSPPPPAASPVQACAAPLSPVRHIQSASPTLPMESSPVPPMEIESPVPHMEIESPVPPRELASPGHPTESSPVPTMEVASPVPPMASASPVSPMESVSPVPPMESVSPVPPMESVSPVPLMGTASPLPPTESTFPMPPVESLSAEAPAESASPVHFRESVSPLPQIESSPLVPPVESASPVPPLECVPQEPPTELASPMPTMESASPVPPMGSASPVPPMESVSSLPPMKSISPVPLNDESESLSMPPVELVCPLPPVESPALSREPSPAPSPAPAEFPCEESALPLQSMHVEPSPGDESPAICLESSAMPGLHSAELIQRDDHAQCAEQTAASDILVELSAPEGGAFMLEKELTAPQTECSALTEPITDKHDVSTELALKQEFKDDTENIINNLEDVPIESLTTRVLEPEVKEYHAQEICVPVSEELPTTPPPALVPDTSLTAEAIASAPAVQDTPTEPAPIEASAAPAVAATAALATAAAVSAISKTKTPSSAKKTTITSKTPLTKTPTTKTPSKATTPVSKSAAASRTTPAARPAPTAARTPSSTTKSTPTSARLSAARPAASPAAAKTTPASRPAPAAKPAPAVAAKSATQKPAAPRPAPARAPPRAAPAAAAPRPPAPAAPAAARPRPATARPAPARTAPAPKPEAKPLTNGDIKPIRRPVPGAAPARPATAPAPRAAPAPRVPAAAAPVTKVGARPPPRAAAPRAPPPSKTGPARPATQRTAPAAKSAAGKPAPVPRPAAAAAASADAALPDVVA